MKLMSMSQLDVARIRKDFPILNAQNGKALIYLDSASTSQKPKQVIEAVKQYYEQYNANVHRGIYAISEEATAQYEHSHKVVGEFIGARANEIVFTRNATEAINLVAYAWGLRNIGAGDNVVVTEMEHHSNFVPWQQIANMKNAELRVVGVKDDGELDFEQLNKLVDGKTSMVAVTHMSNVLGTINDVKAIADVSHDKDALVLVDGAQSVPHIKVDVKRLDCDFMAFSGHKMLGPMGIGALYGKKEALQHMEPFLFGGDMIKQVTVEKTTWNELPWKFEAGTPNVAGGIGWSAAIGYLNKIGMDNVEAHEKELLAYATERLGGIRGMKIYGTSANKGGIVSFNLEGIHPHDVATVLDSEGIAVRAGHHCCQPLMKRFGVAATARASFYIYNTKEEIDELCEGLDKVKKVFKR